MQQEFALSVVIAACREGAGADDLRPFVPYLLEAVKSDNLDVAAHVLTLIVALIKDKSNRELFSPVQLTQVMEQACSNLKRFYRNQVCTVEYA